jgi:Lipocalin-like domain
MKPILILFLSFLFSCSSKEQTESKLNGSWTMEKNNSGDIEKETVVFREDHTLNHVLEVVGKSKMTSEGTYKVIEDSQFLYISLDDGSNAKFKILGLSKDSLQLLTESSKNTLSLKRN